MVKRWTEPRSEFNGAGVLTAKGAASEVSCTVITYQKMHERASLNAPPETVGDSYFMEGKLNLSDFPVLLNVEDKMTLQLPDGRSGVVIIKGTYNPRGWNQFGLSRVEGFTLPE